MGANSASVAPATVLVDGEPRLACLTLPIQVQGCEITTIEGLATGNNLHPLQSTFAELGAAQCGYCTPGMLLSAKALLDRNPHPTRDEIKHALSGNLCRCTGYVKIYQAVERASEMLTHITRARLGARGSPGERDAE
jgi:carbon-monoxide dehydrogenase small subunit